MDHRGVSFITNLLLSNHLIVFYGQTKRVYITFILYVTLKW